MTSLNPTLRFLGPYVTVCNSWNSFWTFAAEHLSAPTNTGSQQRAMVNSAPENLPGGDGVTQIGANEFAHGKESPEPGADEDPAPQRALRAGDHQGRQGELRRRPAGLRPEPQPVPRSDDPG